jgi:hypothetical protein
VGALPVEAVVIDWLKQLLGAHRFAPPLTAVGMREEIATLLNRHRVGFVRNVAVAGYVVDFLLDDGVVIALASERDTRAWSWAYLDRFVDACERRGTPSAGVAHLVVVMSSRGTCPVESSSITVSVVRAEAA